MKRNSANHPCEGGCFRTVSGTKHLCFGCLALALQVKLKEADEPRTLSECKKLLQEMST